MHFTQLGTMCGLTPTKCQIIMSILKSPTTWTISPALHQKICTRILHSPRMKSLTARFLKIRKHVIQVSLINRVRDTSTMNLTRFPREESPLLWFVMSVGCNLLVYIFDYKCPFISTVATKKCSCSAFVQRSVNKGRFGTYMLS